MGIRVNFFLGGMRLQPSRSDEKRGGFGMVEEGASCNKRRASMPPLRRLACQLVDGRHPRQRLQHPRQRLWHPGTRL